MKKIVVINGHPGIETLTGHLLEKFIEGQEALGNEITRINARDYGLIKQQLGVDHEFPAEFSEPRDAILAADYIACFAPMWNLGVPAVMKNFIDGVCQSGYFFNYGGAKGVTGLLKNQKIVVVWLSGGPAKVMKLMGLEMTAKHIKSVFKYYGVKKTEDINFRIHKPTEEQIEQMEDKMRTYRF